MPYKIARQNMVRNQIARRGVTNERVIRAFLDVPRHMFVDTALYNQAYSDNALPIGASQTISQPYMVALMTQILDIKSTDKILEIGTGCGYQTSILCKLSDHVYSIERVELLHENAKINLQKIDASGYHLKCGDGTIGWQENAPFDKIIVTAGAPSVPDALFKQLAEGGSMIIPVGNKSKQELLQLDKINGEKIIKSRAVCVFVPLIGENGW